jgi:dipeptidyl aminopeptidase/acylaminoacyl peptidase
VCIAVVAAALGGQASAQSPAAAAPAAASDSAPVAPRPISHADFDGWRTVATPVLSRDGRWLAYSFQPQDGDGELVIRELASGKERREPIGKLPPPSLAPNDENPDAPPVPRAIRLHFSGDSRFVVATTYPGAAETAAARKARRRAEDMPRGGLLIVPLAGGAAARIADVKSVQVPARGAGWVAYLKEEARSSDAPVRGAAGAASSASTSASASDARPSAAVPATAPAAGTGTGSGTVPAADTPRKTYGTALVLRCLEDGGERVFADVLDAAFTRDGKTLAYSVASRFEAANGVFAVTPGSDAPAQALLAGPGKYLKLGWDRAQAQLVFLSDRDDAAARAPAFKLYRWQRGAATATELLAATSPGFPAGMAISDRGPATTLAFSRDGSKVLVPAAPPAPPPTPRDAQPAEEDKVIADLWRWNDDFVQPIQKVRATQERNRSFVGVVDLASGRYTQLADASLRTVVLSDDGRRALGSDDTPYRRQADYDGRYADLYTVDPATGARKLALKRQREGFGANTVLAASAWSPDGRWLAYYRARQWHLLDTAGGTSRVLTATLGRAVHNEEHDAPAEPDAYGTAGWTADSQSLLVYDRYDVWQLFADGRRAVNLTRGEGRRQRVQLRVQRTEAVEEDDDERGISPNKPLVLRGVSETTRATGFFRTRLDAGTPLQRLLWADQNLRFVARAPQADVLLLSAQRFDLYPDLHTTGPDFAALSKVTDGGAQMAPFLWGRGELMGFKTKQGRPLQAAVYKPANFDPKKKYPLLVYIYERLSQGVHDFRHPAPSHNINFSQYTSNGYVVMTPDIAYTTGQPGKSALDAVLPAIDALARQGFIDAQRIGIAGHSWGGYQIAYMVTQTNRFRAAEAGAPVGNMTSAYSGIRWGTGLPRQFQYEQSQSRIGRPLPEAPALYLANSPVFHAPKVKTPLLILHNDNDDAVPWYQGIELFLALRRYGKEAWFFNYNGEFHGLRRRADQKDYALRMNQFFDHFLKGAPAPEWMDKGIPFIDRDEEKLRFRATTATAPARPS